MENIQKKDCWFLLDERLLYVRTSIGCWKIVYNPKEDCFSLYHRNATESFIELDEVEEKSYHRQKDVYTNTSVIEYLKYIAKHDQIKALSAMDYRRMPKDSEKQKRMAKAAKKREEKKNRKRVDELFKLIEFNGSN